MPLIPDWAPNIHPLIVHFPVAILTLAILGDLIAQFLKRRSWPPLAVTTFYAIGAVAAVVAFASGRAAADSVDVPAAANAALTDHADWGELTMWFFLIYVGLRLALRRSIPRYGPKITVPLFLMALIGGYLLWGTADRGGKLVYGYGVGTRNAAATNDEQSVGDEERDHDTGEKNEEHSGLTQTGERSWSWIPTSTSLTEVRWLTGSAKDLQSEMVKRADGGSAIRISATETPRIFTIGNPLASVQIDATVSLDSLDGSLALLHNVHAADAYGFFSIEGGKGILGRIEKGKESILEQEKAIGGGTVRLRLVADKTHFRGYVNDKLVAHGHDGGLQPGPAGIRFQGKGSFVIERIDIQSLR